MVRNSPRQSVAVVLQLTEKIDWLNCVEFINRLPKEVVFFLITPIGNQSEIFSLLVQQAPGAQVFCCEYKGTYIGGLTRLLRKFPIHEFTLVLHLHAHHSDFYAFEPFKVWLTEQYEGLLPNGRTHLIFDFFEKNPNVGIAGPQSNYWPIAKQLINESVIGYWNKLTSKLSASDFPKNPHFFASGMFWARGSIFKDFADLDLDFELFELQNSENEESFTQALERYFSVIAHNQGLTVSSFDFSDFKPWLSRRILNTPQALSLQKYFASSLHFPKIKILVKCSDETPEFQLKDCLNSISVAARIGVPVESSIVPFSSQPEEIESINAHILKEDFDWLLIISAGDALTPLGLTIAITQLIQNGAKKVIYTDKLIRSSTGSLETAFLPDFNFDLQTSFPWLMSNHWLYSRNVLTELGLFNTEAGKHFELDFIFKLINKMGGKDVLHVSEPLLITHEPDATSSDQLEMKIVEHNIHLSGHQHANVLELSPRLYRIDYCISDLPLISVIMTNQGLSQTQQCLESLLSFTAYSNFELLIVDNTQDDLDSQTWLDGFASIDPKRFKVVTAKPGLNDSALRNIGAKSASGDYFLFVSNSIRFIEKSWLASLLNHAHRSTIGVVGAKVIDASMNIVNAGYVLGLNGLAESAFYGEPFDSNGYLQRLNLDQNYSAVSCDCALIGQAIYQQSGGFNSLLETQAARDVDFCLRIRELGLNNVWTPHAIVQLVVPSTEAAVAVEVEVGHIVKSPFIGLDSNQNFLSRWMPEIADDPAYNKNLSLVAKSFSVEPETDLTWQPMSWRPNPVIVVHPSDETGSGQYRVIKPMAELRDNGIVDGAMLQRYLAPAELERIKPDALIFQRNLSRQFLDYMKSVKDYSSTFKVYEIDDLMQNMPLKSNPKSTSPKVTVKLLREGIALADRLVVSTPGLAEAYATWNKDIKILELKLPQTLWKNLPQKSAERLKPRVGWAGGSTHTSDLELIADVVKDLSGEVDWIFFGMCPQKFRPYIKEFHSGVPFHMYPKKLAELDLDLALAPLENSQFNDCKSNLRLLEYGACGLPVICSNTRAYVESKLPVQIVKNRYKDWMDAIRSHVNDIEACKAKGAILQIEVQAKWMLNAAELDRWKNTWLP
jgi:glycosyltransferase involved in cell wall biosynthesis